MLKGVYQLRPPQPRYASTWEVSKLIQAILSLAFSVDTSFIEKHIDTWKTKQQGSSGWCIFNYSFMKLTHFNFYILVNTTVSIDASWEENYVEQLILLNDLRFMHKGRQVSGP
jgi:hypothetical protein